VLALSHFFGAGVGFAEELDLSETIHFNLSHKGESDGSLSVSISPHSKALSPSESLIAGRWLKSRLHDLEGKPAGIVAHDDRLSVVEDLQGKKGDMRLTLTTTELDNGALRFLARKAVEQCFAGWYFDHHRKNGGEAIKFRGVEGGVYDKEHLSLLGQHIFGYISALGGTCPKFLPSNDQWREIRLIGEFLSFYAGYLRRGSPFADLLGPSFEYALIKQREAIHSQLLKILLEHLDAVENRSGIDPNIKFADIMAAGRIQGEVVSQTEFIFDGLVNLAKRDQKLEGALQGGAPAKAFAYAGALDTAVRYCVDSDGNVEAFMCKQSFNMEGLFFLEIQWKVGATFKELISVKQKQIISDVLSWL
jgi:hypothetical protein